MSDRPPRTGAVLLLLLALSLLAVQIVVFPGLKIEAAGRDLPGKPGSLVTVLLHPMRIGDLLLLGLTAALFLAVVAVEVRTHSLARWLDRLTGTERGTVALLVALTAVLTRYYLDPGIPGVYDAKLHMMQAAEAARSLGSGRLPEYSFTYYGGYPFLRFCGPLLYVLAALPTLLLGSVAVGLKLTLWLAHVGSALAVYSLIRTIGGGRRGALLGAVAAAISFQHTHGVVLAGRLPVALLYLFFPLFLRDLVRLVREPRFGTAAGVAVWAALLVHSHPGLSTYGVLAGAIFAAVLALGSPERLRRIRALLPPLLFAAVLAAALAGGLVIPALIESHEVHASEMYAPGGFEVGSLPRLGALARLALWSNGLAGHSVTYVGLSLLLLFGVGILRGRDAKGLRFALGLTAASLLLLVGGGYLASRSVHFLVVILAAGAGLAATGRKPPLFAGILLLVLLDLGPTTVQSPFRPDLGYDVAFLRRAASRTGGERAVRVSLRKGRFRVSQWAATYDSGQPLITGPFREAASRRTYPLILDLLDRLERDLDAGRITPATRFGLRAYGCRYLLLENGSAPVTPADVDPAFEPVPGAPGLLRVRGASPAVAVLDPETCRRLAVGKAGRWEDAYRDAPPGLRDPQRAGARVSGFRFDPLEVSFRVEAQRAGVLLLSFTDYPGVLVDLDGESVGKKKAPFGLLAVEISPGSHGIRVRFCAPRYLRLWWAISGAGWLLVVAMAFLTTRRRGPRGPSGPRA